ncbi:MAG: YdbH domain-containing protein [Desulfatitalea sp.]|nr:YdbH domain-containing protein [Desulfatitalea sp.]
MPLSRSHKWILVLAGLMLCLGGLLALALFLPFYLETRLLPRWATEAGLDPQIIRLRRIGWRGTDTGPIRLNMGDLSFGEVDAIQIDYSPASLVLGRIDGIVLSGLNLSLTLNEAGNAIAGWNPPDRDRPADAPAASVADLSQKMPVGLKRLALRNAMITVHWRGRSIEIPLELDSDTSRLDQGRLQAKARLSPRGNPIHLTADMETGANTLALTVSAKGLELSRFADLLALFSDLPLAGRVDLEAQTRCRLQPLAVASMAGEARFSDMTLPLAGGRLVHRGRPEAEAIPIVIQWKSDDGRNFPWSLGPFSYQGPATLHVDGVEGRIALEAQGWGAEALAHTILPVQPLAPGGSASFLLLQPLTMDLFLSAREEKGKALQWALHTREIIGATENRFCLQQADWQVESQAPRLEAVGQVDKGALLGRFQVSVAELSAQGASASAKLPGFTLDGAFQTVPELAIQSTAELSGLHCALGEATVTLPQIRMEAGLKKDGPHWAVAGELTLADGHAQYAPQDVRLGQIALRLPVHYPLQPQPPPGDVAVGQMLWQSRPLGTLQGKIGLGSAGLWTELRHASKLFPGMNVQVRSELDGDGAFLTLSVPAFKPATAVDLGRITPAAEGFLFQGRIEAQAEARAKGHVVQSRGRIRIDQGTLHHAGRQMTLEGIACDLRLEDLINPRSEPRQQLRVADLTLGKLAAQQLSLDFQLEPPATLFIEKAGMQWCKGSMQTQAFRLMPGRDEVEVTVYCDRLNLAMLLDQLGAAQGSGEGAVNGRIPLLWKNGELRFDNGFLYSTPGQTGTIRLSGTQTLLEGLAPGTAQHTQLDIASEALKDYSYNWARVDLRSEGELLLVSLKLDGKPNHLLPFAYDPQSGGFKRFSGQGQAEFQGINIDLNFKTPLREILHYRQMMAPKNK